MAGRGAFHGHGWLSWDQNQRIFPYRDYVIDAFNRITFDQFTIEQLGGRSPA